MTRIESEHKNGRLSVRLILELFGIDLASPSSDDEDMPKVDPAANRMKTFLYTNDVTTFNAEFDAWSAQVEKDGNGTLEITHEEPVVDGDGASRGITILYRVSPRAAIARRR